MDLPVNYFLNQIEGMNLKEWRSRKELENFLLEKNRYWEVIGYVTKETLNKWEEEKNLNNRGLFPLRDNTVYLVQKGYIYLYLILQGKPKHYYKSKI